MTAESEAPVASAIDASILPPIGAAFGGGFYGGQIKVGENAFAIIWAPKAEGQKRLAWLNAYTALKVCNSRYDSVANTAAMAAAGSPAALFATGLSIGGFTDWVVPARDVLELGYRHFKPTDETNYADGNDGINPSSVPAGQAYTEESPAQTEDEAFAEGGAEAFDDTWYWSSTQSTQYSDYDAWTQDFDDGLQGNSNKKYEGAVRAVRLIQLSA